MQSKRMSLYETLFSTAVGFFVSYIATQIVLPAYGFPITHSQNIQITAIFTVISVVRGYFVRRFFTYLHTRENANADDNWFARANTSNPGAV